MTVEMSSALEVNQDALDAFLRRFFGPGKASFLAEHGAWLHGGNENRWILKVDGTIAGYCAVIPTVIDAGGLTAPAVWWVDIMIAPEFRGQHLQSYFDRKLQDNPVLKVGFPNEVAAKIHRKHHWGVREDLQVLLCPLKPLQVRQVAESHAGRGVLLKAGAALLTPVSALYQALLKIKNNPAVVRLEQPSAEMLAQVFEQAHDFTLATTHRDEGYLRHRFLEAPYAQELRYYQSSTASGLRLVMVTRTLMREQQRVTRILDLFGDLSDQHAIRAIARQVLRDASREGSTQVTVMVTLPELVSAFRQVGFLMKGTARFCWLSPDQRLMDAFAGRIHFTLADSDNDETH